MGKNVRGEIILFDKPDTICFSEHDKMKTNTSLNRGAEVNCYFFTCVQFKWLILGF